MMMRWLGFVCLVGMVGCGEDKSPESSRTCGEGTVEQNGVCIASVPCDAGEIWDGTACVPQCGAGTVFDAVGGTCVLECAEGEHYVPSLSACVHVPECMGNSALDPTSEDCVGWPWHELSLETLCARRAYNVCTPVFECGCPHAGQIPFEGATGVLTDIDSCIYAELHACDHQWSVESLRAAEEAGQVTTVPTALAAFDEYFALAPGVCTRPAGWHPQPAWGDFNLVAPLTVGAVVTDAACMDHYRVEPCMGDDSCQLNADWNADPLDPGPEYTCQPALAATEVCTPGQCAPGLFCLEDADTSWRCQTKRLQDEVCQQQWWCTDGLFCRPANLSAHLADPGVVVLDSPTCQPPLSVGDHCFDAAYVLPWANSYSLPDLCATGTYCDVSAASGDHYGLCVAATPAGGACDWCTERAFDPTYGSRTWYWATGQWQATGFTACADDLACDSGGTCAAEISVCPLSRDDVYLFGGVCGEVCAAETSPVDEDRDGAFDCADSDCTYQPECFERVCDDSSDNDGDGPSDCDDVDCCFMNNPVCVDTSNPSDHVGTGACAEVCSGGIDEDGDGHVDCADPECASQC